MANWLFGGDVQAWAMTPPSSTGGVVHALPEATGTVWDSPSDGDQYTNLTDDSGANPISQIETDVDGFIVPFRVIGEVVAVWVDFGASSRQLLISAEAVAAAAELAGTGTVGVASVNGQTGTVVLEPSHIGAAEQGHGHAAGDIQSGTMSPSRLPIGTGSQEVAAGNHGHQVSLNSLTDVSTVGSSTGQVLTRQSDGTWRGANPGGGGGVVNHSELAGLTADDHPQYHTDARGDARYYPRGTANERFLTFVDVATGSESRPSGASRVMWIGGEDPPVNMALGDVWLAAEVS